MRKIIFLTLVMILGMSSVSFGKSYLCITDEERNLLADTQAPGLHDTYKNIINQAQLRIKKNYVE